MWDTTLKAAVDSGLEQLGRLDIVVANAGIRQRRPPAAQAQRTGPAGDDRRRHARVCAAVKATVPHQFSGWPGESLIPTSSVGGLKALHTTGNYTAANHGVVGISRVVLCGPRRRSLRHRTDDDRRRREHAHGEVAISRRAMSTTERACNSR